MEKVSFMNEVHGNSETGYSKVNNLGNYVGQEVIIPAIKYHDEVLGYGPMSGVLLEVKETDNGQVIKIQLTEKFEWIEGKFKRPSVKYLYFNSGHHCFKFFEAAWEYQAHVKAAWSSKEITTF